MGRLHDSWGKLTAAVDIFVIFISRFGFKSGLCLLIAPVPVHCFSITFLIHTSDTFQTNPVNC